MKSVLLIVATLYSIFAISAPVTKINCTSVPGWKFDRFAVKTGKSLSSDGTKLTQDISEIRYLGHEWWNPDESGPNFSRSNSKEACLCASKANQQMDAWLRAPQRDDAQFSGEPFKSLAKLNRSGVISGFYGWVNVDRSGAPAGAWKWRSLIKHISNIDAQGKCNIADRKAFNAALKNEVNGLSEKNKKRLKQLAKLDAAAQKPRTILADAPASIGER